MPRQTKIRRGDTEAASSSAAASSATTASVQPAAGPSAHAGARSKRLNEESAQLRTVEGGNDEAAAAPSKRLKTAAASSSPASDPESSSHAASSVAAHAAASSSSIAATSAPRRSPVALLASVELQLIFALMPFDELRHCWAVSRRWHDATAGLTRSFMQHQKHDVRLRIERVTFLSLLQSPMRLLVSDLTVLRCAPDALAYESRTVPPVDDFDSDKTQQHSVLEYDEYERPDGSDLDPSVLTREHLDSIADRMPQLRHLTAKLAQDKRKGDEAVETQTAKLAQEQRADDSDQEDEDDESDEEYTDDEEFDEDDASGENDADAEERRDAKAQSVAAQEEAATRILARDTAAGTSYRFPDGLVSLRLSLINHGRSGGVGLQVRRLVHSAAQLASLEVLCITLRARPKPEQLAPAMLGTPRGPVLPGCLAPLLTGAARQSLRVLRMYYPGGDWSRWGTSDLQTAFALPRLQKLRLLNTSGDCELLVSAVAAQQAPTQLQQFDRWLPLLNLAASHALARFSGLRVLDCELDEDADPACMATLTQLEELQVWCHEAVDPTALSTALSRCTRMRDLDLRHFGMSSQQLTVILTAMPLLETLTLSDMIALEDFAALSSIPALAVSLHSLVIEHSDSRAREPLDVQRHMSHIGALSALTKLSIHIRMVIKPARAWATLQREWTHRLPGLRISQIC